MSRPSCLPAAALCRSEEEKSRAGRQNHHRYGSGFQHRTRSCNYPGPGGSQDSCQRAKRGRPGHLVKTVRDAGGRAVAATAQMSKEADLIAMVDCALSSLGHRVGAFNAGVEMHSKLVDDRMLSDEAAFVNGAMLAVDGGYTARRRLRRARGGYRSAASARLRPRQQAWQRPAEKAGSLVLRLSCRKP